MNDKLVINLKIADMKLSFTINRDEEALLRESAAEVNRVFDTYSRRLSASSSSEVLAMVALRFAKGYISLDSGIRQLETHLDGFESALDRILIPEG